MDTSFTEGELFAVCLCNTAEHKALNFTSWCKHSLPDHYTPIRFNAIQYNRSATNSSDSAVAGRGEAILNDSDTVQ